jgi:hypothetical protein
VVTKPYGRIILDSLPPMRRTESLSEVTEFLRVNLERAGIAPASSVVKGFEAATL